jgi:hypothetical protein
VLEYRWPISPDGHKVLQVAGDIDYIGERQDFVELDVKPGSLCQRPTGDAVARPVSALLKLERASGNGHREWLDRVGQERPTSRRLFSFSMTDRLSVPCRPGPACQVGELHRDPVGRDLLVLGVGSANNHALDKQNLLALDRRGEGPQAVLERVRPTLGLAHDSQWLGAHAG